MWEPPSSKQLKLDQILSLKTVQERPLLKSFAKRYSEIMGDVRDGEMMLSRLIESSTDGRFGADDISQVLDDHTEALKSENGLFSQAFDKILDDSLRDLSLEEGAAGNLEYYVRLLISLAARAVCWLRLVSIIKNPPPSSDKIHLVDTFSETGRQRAQTIVSESIASTVATLTKRLLSSRTWTGDIPEKLLWEGKPNFQHTRV